MYVCLYVCLSVCMYVCMYGMYLYIRMLHGFGSKCKLFFNPQDIVYNCTISNIQNTAYCQHPHILLVLSHSFLIILSRRPCARSLSLAGCRSWWWLPCLNCGDMRVLARDLLLVQRQSYSLEHILFTQYYDTHYIQIIIIDQHWHVIRGGSNISMGWTYVIKQWFLHWAHSSPHRTRTIIETQFFDPNHWNNRNWPWKLVSHVNRRPDRNTTEDFYVFPASGMSSPSTV